MHKPSVSRVLFNLHKYAVWMTKWPTPNKKTKLSGKLKENESIILPTTAYVFGVLYILVLTCLSELSSNTILIRALTGNKSCVTGSPVIEFMSVMTNRHYEAFMNLRLSRSVNASRMRLNLLFWPVFFIPEICIYLILLPENHMYCSILYSLRA